MSDEHWIKRGVTVVDWPWITDKEVKELCRDYAISSGSGQHTMFSLSGLIEMYSEEWDDEAQDFKSNDARIAVIENFMTKYNLDDNTVVKFWW